MALAWRLAIVRSVDTTAHTAAVQLGPSPTLLPGIAYARHLDNPAAGDQVIVLLPQLDGQAPAIIANLTSPPTP